jgi:uncharacterized protein YjbI with pentapeptide repeats
MDTNSNIPAAEIKEVMLAHLDEIGYGPGGYMTRAKWREECLFYLLKGKEEFKKWQERIILVESLNIDIRVPFGYTFDISKGTTVPISQRCALDFIGVTFESIDANGFIFMQDALFDATTFIGNAGFNNCKFIGMARFGFSTFIESAWYGEATFRNSARFENATFYRMASFRGASFESEILFQKASFQKVNFEDAKFGNVGHFEETVFHLLPPTFRGCQIDNTRLEFSDDSCFSLNEFSEDAVKNFSFLKRLADEHGQTDQALMFNKFELNAKRAQGRIKCESLTFQQKLGNADFWFANSTVLYDKLSDYGRSFTRPLLAYGVLMVVTLLLALGHGLWASISACEREGWNVYEQLYRDQVNCPVVATVGEQKIPLTVPRAAFEYTAYRASGVLDFVDADKQTIAVANRLFNQPIEPMWMRIWGVLKAIASAALLFLAALGLRNKYRIK